MNEIPSMPAPESPTDSAMQTWRRALTQPNENTYAQIASSPKAKASTAYLWVFVASLIQIFLAALVQNQLYGNLLEQSGLAMNGSGGERSLAVILVGALCGAPFGAAITTLFFAAWTAVVQWLAKMFGGRGTYDQLAYAIAAIGAPYAVIAGILTLFSAIPYVGFCFGGILLIAGIYILVLQVMAIKGVNQISWGAAIGALLIPGLVLSVLCACLFGVSIAALLPIMRETLPNFAP